MLYSFSPDTYADTVALVKSSGSCKVREGVRPDERVCRLETTKLKRADFFEGKTSSLSAVYILKSFSSVSW